MDLYVYRLTRLGFSINRAYEICSGFFHTQRIEELDGYINNLEDSWRLELCG